MKSIYFLIFSSLFFACNSSEKSGKNKNKKENHSEKPETPSTHAISSPEDKCISLIDTLPEVFALRTKIELTTKNFNRMVIWVAADPSETKIKYYWLKVGEDNGESIATLLNFYVDPEKEEILFYDVVNDTLITLADWRK